MSTATTHIKRLGVNGVSADDFVGDLFWVPSYYREKHGKVMLCMEYKSGMWKMLYIKSCKYEWHYCGTVNKVLSEEERAYIKKENLELNKRFELEMKRWETNEQSLS